MPNKYYSTDSRLVHRAPGAAAMTSTTTLATISQRVAMRTEYVTIAELEAIKITANNELYALVVELSNDSFSTVVVAARHDFGATEVRQSGAPDSVAGDNVEFIWHTEYNEVTYKDARIRVIISGTSPTVTLNARSSVVGP